MSKKSSKDEDVILTERKKDHNDDEGPEVASVDSSVIEEREQWGNKLDFLLTCVGYAVGFGNVWRFPNLCFENGGGAFLIPYFIFLVICGMPLFFMELALSQYIGQGPIGIWKAVSPLFQGIGYSMLVLSFLVCVYYNTIIAWVFYYLFQSFRSDVPWRNCDNTWNTKGCFTGSVDSSSGIINQTIYNATTNTTIFKMVCDTDYNMVNITNSTLFNCTLSETAKRVLPSEQYLNNFVWKLSKGIDEVGEIPWQLGLCLLLSWIVVYFCIWKGVKSVGKVVYVTATFPYLVLLILMVRGATLPGSLEGVTYFLKPDFKKLADPQVWVRAASQIFYSLGVGFGSLIAMGSYNKFKNNCYRDAVMVSLINCGTSVFCGFVVFSVLGHMSYALNMDIKDVAKSGPGLVFVVYPAAIARMPISTLWSILFFLMLITLGLDSQFAMIEVVIAGVVDEYPKYLRKFKEIFIAVMCFIAFLFALPTVTQAGAYVVELFNTQAGGISLLFLAFFETVAIGWIYGGDRLLGNVEEMIGYRPCKWWVICWKYMSPVIILVTFFYGLAKWEGVQFGDNYEYPLWAEMVGWLLAFSSMICMPIGAIIYIVKLSATSGGDGSVMKRLFLSDEARLKQMAAERHGGPMEDDKHMIPNNTV